VNVEFRVRDNLFEVRFASPRDAATVYTEMLRHRMTVARKANRIVIYVPDAGPPSFCDRCGQTAPLFESIDHEWLCASCTAILDPAYTNADANRVEVPP